MLYYDPFSTNVSLEDIYYHVDIFVSKKLQFNNEKYSQGEWKKLGWHDLFDDDVSNLIQGSFSS